MKNVLLAVFVLTSMIALSQKNESLSTFESLDSDIGATINIMKSEEYKISVSGNSDVINYLNYEIDDKNLKIRSSKDKVNFDEVVITVYTPSISVLSMSDGGKATVDKSFSRVDSFVVSASGDAVIDLSDIEFNTLVANSSDGGQIVYKQANTVVNSSSDGGKVKSIQ